MAEYVFKVNGITRSTSEDKPLLRYLRDDLNLKSDDGQAIFPTQLVAHVPYAVIAPFVGIIFAVVYEIYGAENNVIVDVSFVNVRREYIFMLPLCYRVGKLLSDFMGFLIIDFPRLKGLYQMKG